MSLRLQNSSNKGGIEAILTLSILTGFMSTARRPLFVLDQRSLVTPDRVHEHVYIIYYIFKSPWEFLLWFIYQINISSFLELDFY